MTRTTSALPDHRRRNATAEHRQTTCKVCLAGIYVDQPRVWSRKPMGLLHAECVTP